MRKDCIFHKLGFVLSKIIIWRFFVRLIWLTLFVTCSVIYTCHRIDRFPIWNVDTLYFQKNYSPRKLTFCIFYKKTLKVKNLSNCWCYCKFEFVHANPSYILICFKIDDWTSPVVDSFQNCGRELTLQTQKENFNETYDKLHNMI